LVTRIKAIGLLAAVFVLGGISGASVTFAYSRHELAEMSFPPGLRPPQARLRGLSRALDLTDAQAKQVRTILDRHHGDRRLAWDEIVEKCGEPIRKQKAAVDAEIRALLNPDQQRRFDALSRRQEERFFRPRPH
jgi:Spy/CpxP family protein refolding chaperone